MSDFTKIFGTRVFNDTVMRKRLPSDVYKSLRKTIDEGEQLDPSIAGVVASTMKHWAIELGATHFTHWFLPMTGITAEKHDSFINSTPEGTAITEFSAKELIKGEPDASSFPSGGLRATFEARGYTAWDPTSSAFVKDDTLYIPCVFFAYDGHVLDKKTPLLRSMEAISKQALRILRLFGDKETTRVTATLGAEQDYFLIPKAMYYKRRDLVLTGRTLFGAKPPKGQELDDHYFGNIKEKVQRYMRELDEELWALGICAKTEHNEVAPAQHELAPIFASANVAADQNQLIMELMKKVAYRHDMACLLHEKPFAGINGSGKHNNWSLSTNSGKNLLDPGNSPEQNAQFLLFLCAVIKAIDEYAELLRISTASAGNDHRLGGNEAPPAIISVFLGEDLTDVFNSIETGEPLKHSGGRTLEVGLDSLPKLPADASDRNRTSPFAFTGTKFEFRMPGSSKSVDCPTMMLNTIVAEELRQFADELEAADNFNQALNELIKRVYKEHKRVIFDGNGYSYDWQCEAERRGLPNLTNTVDAVAKYTKPKYIEVMERHGILTADEIKSRQDILFEEYSKAINIEALTMLDMAKRKILPACIEFTGKVSDAYNSKQAASLALDLSAEKTLLTRLSRHTGELSRAIDKLDEVLIKAHGVEETMDSAYFFHNEVIPCMLELRKSADSLEMLVSEEAWPIPNYSDLLYSL